MRNTGERKYILLLKYIFINDVTWHSEFFTAYLKQKFNKIEAHSPFTAEVMWVED